MRRVIVGASAGLPGGTAGRRPVAGLRPPSPGWGRRAAVASVWLAAAATQAAGPGDLPPWPETVASSGPARSGWRPVGLPKGKAPPSRLAPVTVDGARVLELQSDASYGTLVHDMPPGAAAGTLSWRWRLLQPNPAANLREKAGDDSPLKVCASFELPLSAVPFGERQLLRIARSVSGQDLPAATICYVWDGRLAAGTALDNVYSRRMRWLVLRGPESALGAWQAERRDLAADFLKLFGDEASAVPPLKAIVVGADADNTGGRSLAQIGAMRLD